MSTKVIVMVSDRDNAKRGEITVAENPRTAAHRVETLLEAGFHPQQITRVSARFEDYQGKYAYHGHILEHEDHDMMRQFQTVFPGDTDGDCDVDLADLAAQLSNFGTTSGATLADGDTDRDGDVDLADLALLLSRFGRVCQ